jgi:hypothetical protein
MALFAALAALALVVAGCGSGGDSTGSTEASSSSLTKAEFLEKGNAICAKGNEEIEAGFEEFSKENNLGKKRPSKAQLEEAIETVLIPKIRKQVEGIAALSPPSGDEAEVEAIVDAAEEALEKGEEDPSSLAGESNGPFVKANKLASKYGLVKCAEEEGEEG